MKIGLFFLFWFTALQVLAQDKQTHQQGGQVEGIVFDHDTKDRIAKTNIINTRTGASFYNDLKGAFKVDAEAGDVLVFIKQDYLPDTIKLTSNANMVVYLQRNGIPLKEVTIRDTLNTPQLQLKATKREYSKAYGSNSYDDILGGGSGLSIDALYNSFSRSGRNAAHLQQIIQEDYQQNVISYRFNRTFVGYITKLKDQELTDFMYKYRPGYYLVTAYTDYEFITYIRNNLRRYLRNKRAYTIPPLVPVK